MFWLGIGILGISLGSGEAGKVQNRDAGGDKYELRNSLVAS